MDEDKIIEMVRKKNELTVIGLKALYDLFIEKGFSEDQALKLTIIMVEHI